MASTLSLCHPRRVTRLVRGQAVSDGAGIKYGPFVMNTQAQIVEAVQDFQSGRL